ncbi:MAG: hypothetical protein KBD85_01435 [Elusimicrobia bacterium]|nr:hypothetical protein [Elusimicrobiota bacterium]MBP9698656.1 hypothetical protein [Elusimicrobiota bacterium]
MKKIYIGNATFVFILPFLVMCLGCKEKGSDSAQRLQLEMDNSKASITKTIKDSDRADKIIALSEKLAPLFREMEAQQSAFQKECLASIERFETTPADLKELTDHYREKRGTLRNECLLIRQQMAELMTDEEWKRLLSSRQRMLKQVFNSF